MRKTLAMTSCLGLFALAPLAHANNLVFCSEASPAGFDGAQYTSSTDNDASEPIYNRLTEFKQGDTTVVPALATSWDVSEDGLVYTFHLREGVKFHSNKNFKPSRDFNADDVVFTFNRMLNPEHPFRKAYPTEFPYFTGMGLNKKIKSIEKTGPLTVVFTLNTVDAAFIQNIAMNFASILSAEYAEQLMAKGDVRDINQQPIGTGPFVFQRYQKDSQIRYKGNKEFWDPSRVKIDQLIFAIVTDASARMQKLKANECQVSVNPRPADLAKLKEDKSLQIIEKPGFNLGYISYNVRHEPLGKLEVRQALDMAVNKKAIINAGSQRHAANPVVLRRQHQGRTLQPGKSQRAFACSRGQGRHRTDPLGHAGTAPLQPQCEVDGRDASGRLEQGGHQGQDRQLRMGRIPQAHQEWRARYLADRLDRRQR
ncbi:Dipeptide ABC transporter periplasmic dipeptide-binding protein [Pseudomonas coronafaciens pv. porri]|nr:Dipeptide ABC transporter periplasmic dipeptide-binding protein [Pseudomonas coronafaciens pv. porri]RMU89456.1 Dipeptide ABC transporter periplasmic dipeptide-binding protein [Pseudomonas coronafaciens pv. porri]RMV99397.1 Dipeptide ABC transporter periplasmic dipeptide-binding protein [Pseudomonas coronafaciens pv. porri]RMW11800.1 Dipeptide ABC transporter periplasmic dipeptide-binding protein [Pseudomonas coronafaciens pv. porri]